MDPARTDTIFDEIKKDLVPFLEKVLGPDATSETS
jgi:hypothetical protein